MKKLRNVFLSIFQPDTKAQKITVSILSLFFLFLTMYSIFGVFIQADWIMILLTTILLLVVGTFGMIVIKTKLRPLLIYQIGFVCSILYGNIFFRFIKDPSSWTMVIHFSITAAIYCIGAFLYNTLTKIEKYREEDKIKFEENDLWMKK